MGKESACKAGDVGSVPGSGRSAPHPPHSCLKNPMHRGAWWATVHGVTEGRMDGSDGALTLWKWCWTKKQIPVIFLSSKWVVKRWRQLAFGPGAANECSVRWWVKEFCKGRESLDDEEHSGHQKLTGTAEWEPSLKLILLQLHEKLPKLNIHHSAAVRPLKQIGKVKKLKERVPHKLTATQKKSLF